MRAGGNKESQREQSIALKAHLRRVLSVLPSEHRECPADFRCGDVKIALIKRNLLLLKESYNIKRHQSRSTVSASLPAHVAASQLYIEAR